MRQHAPLDRREASGFPLSTNPDRLRQHDGPAGRSSKPRAARSRIVAKLADMSCTWPSRTATTDGPPVRPPCSAHQRRPFDIVRQGRTYQREELARQGASCCCAKPIRSAQAVNRWRGDQVRSAAAAAASIAAAMAATRSDGIAPPLSRKRSAVFRFSIAQMICGGGRLFLPRAITSMRAFIASRVA